MEDDFQALWDEDEFERLELGERVMIDLSWYANGYGDDKWDFLLEHGHGMEGKVNDRVKDVDGFYTYYVACYDGVERGAYDRKDLIER